MKKAVSAVMLIVAIAVQAATGLTAQASTNGEYGIAYNSSITQTHSASKLLMNTVTTDGTFVVSEENGVIDVHDTVEAMPDLSAAANELTPNFSVTALQVGAKKDFPTLNPLNTNERYTLNTELMAVGNYCYVWVETAEIGTNKMTAAKAASIAKEFDRTRDMMVDNFGKYFSNESYGATNGRIDILVHKIPSTSTSYILGYFSRLDFLSPRETAQSTNNQRAIIHVGTNPAMGAEYNPVYIYETLVHEFQHLINFTNASLNSANYTELWLDEALAMAAEHMVYGPLSHRIRGYYSSPAIKNGASLVYQSYSANNEINANYSGPYMFMQYLRTQTNGLTGGGTKLYKSVVESSHNGYKAVTEALAKTGYSVTDFAQLNMNFRIAAFLNNSTGVHGFRGDNIMIGVTPDMRNNLLYTDNAVNLKPTGAVIFAQNGRGINNAGGEVMVAGFNANGLATVAPTAAPTTAVAPATGFQDIGNYEWARDAINELAKQGIIKGISATEFAPASQIKRADFMLMLTRLLNIEDVDFHGNFADVTPDKYYYDAVGRAKALGLATGYEGYFNPEGQITRQDMFVLAYRAMVQQGLIEKKDFDLATFADANLIAGYAQEAIAAFAALGIVKGDNGNVNPLSQASRAETAVLVYRLK